MAAHQICLQVWLVVSLLTDALVASGRDGALLVDLDSTQKREIVTRKKRASIEFNRIAHKVSLAAILGLSFGSLATLFTKDAEVLGVVKTGVLVCLLAMSSYLSIFVSLSEWSSAKIFLVWRFLKLLHFVSASQPVNALAFIFDGLHYGVSDFPYAACSMMVVGAISSAFQLYVPSIFGLREYHPKMVHGGFTHRDLKDLSLIVLDDPTITKAFVPHGHHRNLDPSLVTNQQVGFPSTVSSQTSYMAISNAVMARIQGLRVTLGSVKGIVMMKYSGLAWLLQQPKAFRIETLA
ncbi:hypothetical protein LOK49_LG12G02844 [Camellia lanceoleosa]|uniref:Uncharacterized protein n=1 Tax=Camellia lanceoleosa TaxID=1840588 RepID=A0ACC0FUG8_9ERIC|nr:hypothetical protein LOK49_LG12G02844 [Camellia lanceoleosa]